MLSTDIRFKLILRSMPEITVLRSDIRNTLYILCGKLSVTKLLPVLFRYIGKLIEIKILISYNKVMEKEFPEDFDYA